MNSQQLLEMALLDSCGILEADELETFETAFAAAPESVKAQIRREQSRFADQTQLLPNVEPRPELRRLVIDAVREAAGRVSASSMSIEEFVRSSGSPTPADMHQRRVFPIWRAAAVVLAATTVFGAVVSFELKNQIDTLGDHFSTNTSADFFLRFGELPGLQNVVLSEHSYRVAFVSLDDSSTAQAAVFSNPVTDKSFLLFKRLPKLEDGQYEIVALDDNNEITGTIASFKSNGETDGHEFAFDSALRGSIGIAVRTAAGGLRLVMVSA